tara:strand:+ start:4364 stop:4570 length:207 start_codon:yes stop_codon:yes gene_type:complete
MNKLIKPLAVIFLLVPASIFVATLLWNIVLTSIVTWANPITFWQMFGLMVLLWIIYPGRKPSIKQDND